MTRYPSKESPRPPNSWRRRRWLAIPAILALVAVVWLAGNGFVRPQPAHPVATVQPFTPLPALNSAAESLARGDVTFDRGKYGQALADYSRAIELKPDFAEAYNNRAYTYMTIEDYARALPDLDQAISLRPTYANALMNRGDIYNFYYKVDRQRAIDDYDRVLAIDPTTASHTSVCGHRAIAINNGMTVGLYFKMALFGSGSRGC